MKRQTPEDRFAYIVPVHREHDYQAPKKRKYTGIRNTSKHTNELITAGHMVDIYYDIKHDEVFCSVYVVGKAKLNTEYTVFITTLLNRKYNEREMRKMLDTVIEAKGYDRIRFS